MKPDYKFTNRNAKKIDRTGILCYYWIYYKKAYYWSISSNVFAERRPSESNLKLPKMKSLRLHVAESCKLCTVCHPSPRMPFSLISLPFLSSLISRNRAGSTSSCFLGQQESSIAGYWLHFHIRGRKVGEPAAISGRPWGRKGLTLPFSLFCETRWRGPITMK